MPLPQMAGRARLVSFSQPPPGNSLYDRSFAVAATRDVSRNVQTDPGFFFPPWARGLRTKPCPSVGNRRPFGGNQRRSEAGFCQFDRGILLLPPPPSPPPLYGRPWSSYAEQIVRGSRVFNSGGGGGWEN